MDSDSSVNSDDEIELKRNDVKINHFSIQDLLKNFKCPDCKKVFPFDFLLEKHQKKEHPVKTEAIFLENSPLADLLRGAVKVEEINTDEEDNFFENTDTRSLSGSSTASVPSIKTTDFSCDICFKTFTQKRYIGEHKIRAHQVSKLKCPECQRPYNMTGNLRRHLIECHDYDEDVPGILPKKPGFFQCGRCDKRFHLFVHLKNHQEQDHTIDIEEMKKKLERKKPWEDSQKKEDEGELLDAEAINKIFRDFIDTIPTAPKSEQRVNEDNPAECDICHKSFQRRRYLTEHMRISHDFGNYNCPKCSKNYNVRGAFLNHLKLRHPKYKGPELLTGAYTCDLCGKKIHKLKEFRHHMDVFHSTNRFPCPICHTGNYTKSGLLDHKKQKHLKNLKPPHIQCREPHCTVKCFSEGQLTAHMRAHEEPSFRCPQCPKLFKRSDTLRNHRVREHGSGMPKFRCTFPDCTLTYHKASLLNNHLRLHDENGVLQKNWECEICQRKFLLKSGLTGHLKIHEDRPRNIDCTFPGCNMKFFSEKLQSVHYKTMHVPKTKDVQCTLCDQSFFTSKHLANHVLQRHNRKFECFLCGKSYGFMHMLKKHMHRTHQENID